MVQTIVDFLTVWKLDDFLGHCTVEHNKASVHCSLTFEIEKCFFLAFDCMHDEMDNSSTQDFPRGSLEGSFSLTHSSSKILEPTPFLLPVSLFLRPNVHFVFSFPLFRCFSHKSFSPLPLLLHTHRFSRVNLSNNDRGSVFRSLSRGIATCYSNGNAFGLFARCLIHPFR